MTFTVVTLPVILGSLISWFSICCLLLLLCAHVMVCDWQNNCMCMVTSKQTSGFSLFAVPVTVFNCEKLVILWYMEGGT